MNPFLRPGIGAVMNLNNAKYSLDIANCRIANLENIKKELFTYYMFCYVKQPINRGITVQQLYIYTTYKDVGIVLPQR